MPDMVNNPPHYNNSKDGLECIDVIHAMLSQHKPDEWVGYLRGNVMKYLWRYQDKGGVEDLKKARWYLDALILCHTPPYEKEETDE